MSYLTLKTLHVSCAALSYALFFLRGVWLINESAMARQRWVKIVPHLIDTVLLTSAIALAMTLHQYPFVDTWLTAKVIALLLYIALGSIALKYAKTRNRRIFSWLAAQAVFGYIILTAINHNPFWMMP